MEANRNWAQLAILLTARIRELGYPDLAQYEATRSASRIYMTCLLSGRARLKLQYMNPLAQALDLDEEQLVCMASRYVPDSRRRESANVLLGVPAGKEIRRKETRSAAQPAVASALAYVLTLPLDGSQRAAIPQLDNCRRGRGSTKRNPFDGISANPQV
jgi:hypothetical protein